VVGEAKQKTLALLDGARGKVLMIDEAYSLDDNQYGKQALDTLVEKVQGSENDDLAVLLLGYTEPMLAMLRNQNPGLARRFAPDQAFYFDDYTEQELLQIMQSNCNRQSYKPSIEFQEKAMRKLETQRRSEPNFGNASGAQESNHISKLWTKMTNFIAGSFLLQLSIICSRQPCRRRPREERWIKQRRCAWSLVTLISGLEKKKKEICLPHLISFIAWST
jgi:hypothetical protein